MRRLVVLLLVLAILEVPAMAYAASAPASSALGSVLALPVATCNWWGGSSNTTLKSIRYHSRRHYRDRDRDRDDDDDKKPSQMRGFAQIHGGFFDPDGDLERRSLFGFRAGTSLDGRAQLGLGVDWTHRTDRNAVLIREVPTPGGGTAEQTVVQSESNSDLVPMLATLQITPAIDAPILPYIGVGGGWQMLFLSAKDFSTNQSYEATYGGWAWQAWAGLGFPISARTRLNGEAFLNGGDVERDINDPSFGTIRERINLNGGGFRAGLNWVF